jgi:hypothetical protein
MASRKDTCNDQLMPRPATGKTPVRNVRIPEALWRDAQEVAKSEGRTMTDVIIAYLRRYGAPARKRREGEPPTEG